MIVCPHCNHQNPEEAVHCEHCYAPLPSTTHCPNCNATVQSDASFCGQCGFNLQDATGGHSPQSPLPPTIAAPSAAPPTRPLPDIDRIPVPPTVAAPMSIPDEPSEVKAPLSPTIATPVAPSTEMPPPDFNIPDLPPPDPLVLPDPTIAEMPDPMEAMEVNAAQPNFPDADFPNEETSSSPHQETMSPSSPPAEPLESSQPTPTPGYVSPPTVAQVPARSAPSHTILQTQTARLLHVQTNTTVELPANLTVIHIGKPNDRIPPDIDVSGFPNSEIVSRVHADIRVEGDLYYIEDVSSANGTYINNMPLPVGNRHRLRPGDRVALGKGDKVTFLFQIS
jgi:pSer/pThr/pTyr-binding forkhead associated (FHA) protein/ribosomal protein L40E